MCSYRNVRSKTLLNQNGDDFDWVMGSGGTPSLFTGPKSDHTTGTSAGMCTLENSFHHSNLISLLYTWLSDKFISYTSFKRKNIKKLR